MTSLQIFSAQLLAVLLPLAVPAFIAIAGAILAELKRRGHHTAYAEALVRAVGVAQIAATARGLSLFTPAGEAAGMSAALTYMGQTVPAAAAALGIDSFGTEQRISAQIGVMAANGAAQAAAAMLAGAASVTVPPLATMSPELQERWENLAKTKPGAIAPLQPMSEGIQAPPIPPTQG